MSTLQIGQQNLAFLKVQGVSCPPEGPTAIPVPLDFTLATKYTLNMQNVISRNFFSMLQSVFIDNSNNPASITLEFDNTSQPLTLEGGEQGYLQVLCQNPAVISFSSTGDVSDVAVYLLNFPVVNCVWVANASLAPSNVAFETFSGGVVHPSVVANLTVTGNPTNTTGTLVTGNPGYYIAGIALQLTSNATLTAGTDLVIKLHDSSSGTVLQAVLSQRVELLE